MFKYADLDTKLIEAAKRGDTFEIKQLLRHGANPQIKGGLPIWETVYRGHAEAFKVLLENSEELTPDVLEELLIGSARKGHAQVLKEILDYSAHLDVDKQGALGEALDNGKAEALKLLLSYGAVLDTEDLYIFKEAIEGGYTEVVKILIENGVNVDGDSYVSPLEIATEEGKTDIVKLLVEAGADTSIWGPDALENAVFDEDEELIRTILLYGGEEVLSEKDSLINIAVTKENASIIQTLIDNGAEINNGGENLRAALYLGNVEIFRLLLDHGADINYLLEDKFLDLNEYKETLERLGYSVDELLEKKRLLFQSENIEKTKRDFKKLSLPLGKHITPRSNTDLELLQRLKSHLTTSTKQAKKASALPDSDDLRDALEHMGEYICSDYELFDPEDFTYKFYPEYPVSKIPGNRFSWVELRREDFKGLALKEVEEELESFRGEDWARRAVGWLEDKDIPPIIIALTPDYEDVADGRGRVNLAIALGLKTLPAWVIETDKKIECEE